MAKEATPGIHIAAVIGTARPGNYTAMALDLVTDEIRRRSDASVEVIDPAALQLPLPGEQDSEAHGEKLRQAVSRATGVVLATPEYHGSYSSVLKLVIENLGFPSVLAGKPVALLGVAAGRIGAIKSLEALRSVCSHVGAIVLPGPVSVAGVRGVFDEGGRCLDSKVEARIRGLAENLLGYIDHNICPRVALEAFARSDED